MTERSVPYWSAHETTEPHHVMASLQYALLVPRDFTGRSNFAFPFPKVVNNEAFQLLVRREKNRRSEQEKFSLDIGHGNGEEEFQSHGWVDFSVRTYRGREGRRIGYLDRNNSIWSGPYVSRPSQAFDHNGIFVEEQLRNQGIGKVLLSLSRGILALRGVDTLIIDEIDEILPDEKRGAFYAGANTHIFGVKEGPVYPSGKMISYGKAAIPTQESKRFPYQFT